MEHGQNRPKPENMICTKCGIALQPGKVAFSYAGSGFPIDLHKCPKCGLVFVPEDLVLGKMRKAERALEDK